MADESPKRRRPWRWAVVGGACLGLVVGYQVETTDASSDGSLANWLAGTIDFGAYTFWESIGAPLIWAILGAVLAACAVALLDRR